MQLPDRVSVPTCIGCGAMGQWGTCERGCSENKLELVRAVELDLITALALDAGARVSASRTVVGELATSRPRPTEYETSYRLLQTAARAVLRRPGTNRELNPEPDEPERATTWWCSRCGGIDAPQPCLGICVWRPIDWANARLYEQERAGALAERDAELRLHELLRRFASITPRAGHWRLGWEELQAEAQAALHEPPPDETSASER